jgi:DNA repair exonuclease SbcCD nuclease subunit
MILLTSDLHLTDKAQDEYRWALFPWLKEQIHKYNISAIIIAGDISDIKDNHTAEYTNRVVDNLLLLEVDIFCLSGNHDYIDHSTPFFRFLNEIPNITFVIEPFVEVLDGRIFQFLSHTKKFSKYTPGTIQVSNSLETWIADYIICHQTFQNAKSENGMLLNGIDTSVFDNVNAKIYCGDIHTPQVVGKVTYIGSPYHVHFSDSFIPRVLLLDPKNSTEQSIYFPTTRRFTLTIEDPKELLQINLNSNDQVKIKLKLNNKLDWDKQKKDIQQICIDQHWDLCKIETITSEETQIKLQNHTNRSVNKTQNQILKEYCIVNKIDQDVQKYGHLILENNAAKIQSSM